MSMTVNLPLFRNSLFFIVGPCAIESRCFALETAEELKGIFDSVGLPFIYKSSFDKANRSSSNSFRGVGLDEGLSILAEVREKIGIPVLTDVHEAWQAGPVGAVVDMLQTPAFLCRQTDFIMAVASAGKPVNFKKGQFLAPWDMKNVITKAKMSARKAGVPDDHFTVCERGTSFGYGNLVVDMRGLQIMADTIGCPVVFDATHSVQLPGAQGTSSGGQREFVPHLARAAVATGAVSGVFLEAHPDPAKAPCDGPNMVAFKNLPRLLKELKGIYNLVKGKEVGPSGSGMDALECSQRDRVPISVLGDPTRSSLGDVRLVITDVDGVLTDGGIFYDATGECLKRFHVRDGLGMRMLEESGVRVAVVSGRDSATLRKRVADLGVSLFRFGVKDKAAVCREIMAETGVTAQQTACIGDDSIDLPAFSVCGFAFAVADAPIYVRQAASHTLRLRGGEGAFREVADMLLAARGQSDVFNSASGFAGVMNRMEQ